MNGINSVSCISILPKGRILAPFPNIAVHVVDAPSIGLKTCYGRGKGKAIIGGYGLRIPSRKHLYSGSIRDVGDFRNFFGFIAVGVKRGRASPASVFPLCLARQSVRCILLQAEPSTKCVGIGWCDVNDGMLMRLRKAGISSIELLSDDQR